MKQQTEGYSLVWGLVRRAAYWAVPALLITALSLIWFYRASTYRIFDDPLVNTIQALIASVETNNNDGADKPIRLTREPIDDRYQLALSGRYWLIGEIADNGEVGTIMESRSLYGATIRLPAQAANQIKNNPGDVVRSTSRGPDNEPLRLAAQSVIFPGETETPVVIIAAADSRPAAKAVQNFSVIALGLMSILALGQALAIFMQVRIGLRPVFKLRRQVADVREGRSKEVEGVYPTEIQPLADELNTLINHNKEVVDYAQTHVGNLAHALKTPLAVLRNEADAKKSKLSGIVGRQSEIMSNQVDHHLRRARAAARGQSIGVKTSINETLTSLSRTVERIYREKDLDIQLNMDDDFEFRGEKRDLEEMAGNLLDNACKWTKAKVYVSVDIPEDDEAFVRIIVDDDGPGIHPDKYADVIKRGERLDEATPGSGFGLSIVNDLARAYKGSLSLDTSPMGGLRTILTIPSIVEAS
ncbi:MAG: sensor histidine kinase [Acidimicrobiales bacterium]|nr:sensor histidine kinase [Hyphomonadaceae bacterium]RZV44907.1 MAG: sensor histidine kinase [Acidimicrobiales bacterium]